VRAVSEESVNAIVRALRDQQVSRPFTAAVARLFGAHLLEVDEYRDCWVDDLLNVRVSSRGAQAILLADCCWTRGYRGQFLLDPCMATFDAEVDRVIPYTLAFGAEERPTRPYGHIRQETAEDWTWRLTFKGTLRLSNVA
jgi:hypothetical protein